MMAKDGAGYATAEGSFGAATAGSTFGNATAGSTFGNATAEGPGGVADGSMAEWRRKLKEILDDAEKRDGRVLRRGGRPRRKAANGVAGNGGADGTNGGKNTDDAVVTCGAGALRKDVAYGVDSGNDGTGNSNGGNTARDATRDDGEAKGTRCAVRTNGTNGGTASGSVAKTSEKAVEIAGGSVAADEKRVTQTALVMALETVSEPLWALVKSVGMDDDVQSA